MPPAPGSPTSTAGERPRRTVVGRHGGAGGGEHVVAQPLEAHAAGVVAVGDHVEVGGQAGHARDLAEHVGLLERHRRADPRRRAERHVRVVRAHAATAEHAAVCRSVSPPITCTPAGRPRSAATSARTVPTTESVGAAAAGVQAIDARGREREPCVVVEHGRGAAVVGEPRAGHRRVRRRGGAGEAHGEVVDGLEVPPGRLRHRPGSSRSRKRVWAMESAPLAAGHAAGLADHLTAGRVW